MLMSTNFKQLLECFRYIFTLEDKDVVAPAFDYFCECLEALMETTSNNGVEFHYKEIPVDFPQYFTYNRSKELVGFLITVLIQVTVFLPIKNKSQCNSSLQAAVYVCILLPLKAVD